MAVMLEKVYRALLAAGAPEREASQAATELAGESRFTSIKSDLKLLKWMVGFNLAMSVALFLLVINLSLQGGKLV